nr:MAG TPA: SCIMP protein [Caudoviricetes sp.]
MHSLEDAVISLIISIAAGVISHLICKWLDRNK